MGAKASDLKKSHAKITESGARHSTGNRSQRRTKYQEHLKKPLICTENINQGHHFNQNRDVRWKDCARFALRKRAKRAIEQAQKHL